MGIFDGLMDLFRPSNKVNIVPFEKLKDKVLYWGESGNYPSYDSLPYGISFPGDFWDRIREIHRHTLGDRHERAVTVWWADGDYVLTENVRGTTEKVNIPKQEIYVEYKPTTNRDRWEKIITVNGKVYAKKGVSASLLKNKKKVEVNYLFNMHTHPQHGGPGDQSSSYSFFSQTDLRSFLGQKAAITALVTDKLWLLLKTSMTPQKLPADDMHPTDIHPTPENLVSDLRVRVYSAEFGKSLITFATSDTQEKVSP